MNKRNRYLAIAGMTCTAAGLLTSVGGTWAMPARPGAGLCRGDDVPGGKREIDVTADSYLAIIKDVTKRV